LTVGELYRVASGMGGIFDVRLVSIDDRTANVRVESPLNPDWHGYAFRTGVGELKDIPILYEVRTRVTADGHLGWGRYSTSDEAEAAAQRARTYPACHPVQIVPVKG
jgi:hypothetical protein